MTALPRTDRVGMDHDKALRNHFVRSSARRRRQIVGDCVQLKTAWMATTATVLPCSPFGTPSTDFTLDVEEMQLLLKGKKAASGPVPAEGWQRLPSHPRSDFDKHCIGLSQSTERISAPK